MRFRLPSRSDLPALVHLLHPGFRASELVLQNLVPLWNHLLLGVDRTAVIEDPSLPAPERIVGFGAAVFVNDLFAEKQLLDPQPYVSAVLYEEVLAGRSPVLSQAEVAAANASIGLNLLVLHFGLRNHDFSSEHTQQILQCGSGAFYFLHAGYRLNLLMQEVYGPQQASYMEAGGFRLISDHSYLLKGKTMEASDENRPYLFALRREWVSVGAVNPLSFLFNPSRPQLGLSGAEQRVLLRALSNESDGAIAHSLGISLDAVKKTWRRTFQKVARGAPYALGKGDVSATARRGAEKRRYLLDYLRTHPQELRPYKPGSRSEATTPAPGKG